MRPATEATLRKRLAELLAAQTERERADAAYKAAANAWLAAGTALKNVRAEVASLLKAEPGAVTYDGYVFRVEPRTGQVMAEPLARDLQPKQEPLALTGST